VNMVWDRGFDSDWMLVGDLELGFDNGGIENGRWTCVMIETLTQGACRRLCWIWVLIVVGMRMGGGLGLGEGLWLIVGVGW
jgi:hypothetical protein